MRLLPGFACLFTLLFALLCPGSLPAAAQEEPRHAVVVGNSAYSFAPLANPGNDAEDIAQALMAAGFQVHLLLDADRDEMADAVAGLSAILKEKGGTGLFFFAGHGVQVEGENYLLPIGDGVSDAARLEQEALSAAAIVDRLSAAQNALNIIILDACRDNPLTGTVSGLSRIDSSARLFISYSTSPGAVALDGDGRNSPYARHLTLSLTTPGLNLEETFKQTLKGVYQETAGQQTPWLSSTFFGDFVFRGDGRRQAEPAVRPADPAAAPARPRLAGVYNAAGTNPNGTKYRGMVALSEQGERYGFTWWIGRDVFRGAGELAGRMLVVDWESTAPVVYDLAPEGVLDGEWADGTATDVLEPFGLAAPGRTPANGRYDVAGRNSDGSRYKGTLDLEGDGRDYVLRWKIGRSAYSGQGLLGNGVLVVDWGGAQPIIYAIREDGSLAGLWDNGRATEIATRR